MKYRNIFIEFMYQYREYFPDTVQLVVMENTDNNDLVNYFSELEETHIFQCKDMQVFHKKGNLADFENTLIELVLMNDQPQVYEISELSGLVDIYNKELFDNIPSKYVYIKPVIKDLSIKAVLLVYSNLKTEWMVSDKKLIKLCDDLQKSISNELYEEVSKQSESDYWIIENNQYYLSNELSKLLKLDNCVKKIDLTGYGLQEISKVNYSNATLTSYQLNNIPQIKGIYELNNLSLLNFSLLYLVTNDGESFESFYSRLSLTLCDIDGKFGKFDLYQIDNEHLCLIYDSALTKKIVEEKFNQFNYILVRSGNEIKQKVDFKMLVEYLNISPIEEFNQEYYKFYCEKYNLEKVKKVITKTSNSKIKVIPIFDSLESKKQGYLVKDIANIKLFDKETKQKSLLSLIKIVEQYQNEIIYLELPLTYLFEGNKLSLSLLNKVKRLVEENKERIFLITNYSSLLNKIYAHWPDFNKYLYFYDIPNNLYSSILSIDGCNGLYINSTEYREFFNTNNIIASKFLQFILQDTKKILINVNKSDIIKYQQENLLLVCE